LNSFYFVFLLFYPVVSLLGYLGLLLIHYKAALCPSGGWPYFVILLCLMPENFTCQEEWLKNVDSKKNKLVNSTNNEIILKQYQNSRLIFL
jgi:hypothetical protein